MPETRMTLHQLQSRKNMRPAIGTIDMDRSADKILIQTMRQALDEFAGESPARMADWIAGAIDPARPTFTFLISDPETSLDTLSRAKDMYKLMRVMAKTESVRRMGRRLYAASIAAAMVHHKVRISDQSSTALERAFHYLLMGDDEMPGPVLEIVQKAIAMLPNLHEAANLKSSVIVHAEQIRQINGQLIFNEAVRSARQSEVKKRPPETKRKSGRYQRKRERREKKRLAGGYDPLLGAHFSTRRSYCPACRDVVVIRRRKPDRMLHGWVALLTLSLWLPVWGMLELLAMLNAWRCVNCRRRIYQALIS